MEVPVLLRSYKLLDDFYFQVNPERISFIPSCQSCCAATTPLVTALEAKYIVASLSNRATDLFVTSMAWLTKSHEGLQSYRRIRGRPYTEEESNYIAREVDVARQISCPFFNNRCELVPYRPILCCVEGIDQVSLQKAKYFRNQMKLLFRNVAPELGVVGFLPTMVARVMNKEALVSAVDQGEIADAKLAISSRLPVFWEEDS